MAGPRVVEIAGGSARERSGSRLTTAERVSEGIADDIVSGVLAPGTRLEEQALADRHGVSRTPIREAIRLLAASGLVEFRPRKGALVTRVTERRLTEMFIAMAEMEATCARFAATNMSARDRAALESHHVGMADLVRRGDPDAYDAANLEFHSRIYAGARNAELAEFTAALRRRLQPFRRAQFRALGRLAKSHAEHEAVVAAILRADAGLAYRRMLDHVALVETAFERYAITVAAATGAGR